MARVAEADAEVMIVSATRGEQGRSAMLRSRPGVLPDGTLQHHRSSLGAAITGIMRSSIRTP